MVYRGEETKRVFINEISTLIISNTAVTVTAPLLIELIKHKVKVIFCDEKHNPLMELMPYYDSYNGSKKIYNQINWQEKIKAEVWTEIVKEKINQQCQFVKELGFIGESDLLKSYVDNAELNDVTNREGHSAKVYFGAIFGKKWNRDGLDFKNNALNYGYTVLLSAFNREIVKLGYLTQLGIWHKNQFNDFNLSCDFIEPFRVLVDRKVYKLDENDKNFKKEMIAVLTEKVKIGGKVMFVEDAISVYVQSVVSALNDEDVSKIKFFECGIVDEI